MSLHCDFRQGYLPVQPNRLEIGLLSPPVPTVVIVVVVFVDVCLPCELLTNLYNVCRRWNLPHFYDCVACLAVGLKAQYFVVVWIRRNI